MENKEESLHLLRKIQKKPNSSQREFADELGLSLGKVNYCLNELKKKGLIKIKTLKKSKQSQLYLYFNSKRYPEKNKTNNKFYEKKNERIRSVKIRVKEKN